MIDIHCSQSAVRRAFESIALRVLLLYALLTLLLAAPLPLYLTETVPRAVTADTWLNIWAVAWTSEHLIVAPGSLFDANIFFPHQGTLAYLDHYIGQALLVAPVYWLSRNATLAYNAAWYLALTLTAWGGFLWLRRLLGDSLAAVPAAFVGGAICLFVPGKQTALGHLQVISLQGLPFALLALHALLRRPGWRWALALAGASTYAALCSWYTAYYAALLLPAVALVGLVLRCRGIGTSTGLVDWSWKRWGKSAVWIAVGLSVAGAAMVPVALPYRAVQEELQFNRPIDELVDTSLRPIDFVASWSYLHRAWMPFGSGAGGWFPGFVALGLALLGLRAGTRRRNPWPLVYAALALGFVALSLGPRWQLSQGFAVPLPYRWLYEVLPGFDALRNPYRAAFVASLLLAVPVAAGAQVLLTAVQRPALERDRWRTTGVRRGRVGGLAWALALALACVHLLEAWQGPQEVAALPVAPSRAHQWLASQEGRFGVLEWPLPRPSDLNARYQLWSVGTWTPLVNGHAGLYPPDFIRLYESADGFPSPRSLAQLKEGFPVRYVLAHFGAVPEGSAIRERADRAPDLLPVWSEGEDVVYELRNGSPGGWLRRRVPRWMLGSEVTATLTIATEGCALQVALWADRPSSGRAPGSLEVWDPVVSRGAPHGKATATGRFELSAPVGGSVHKSAADLVWVEAWLVRAREGDVPPEVPPGEGAGVTDRQAIPGPEMHLAIDVEARSGVRQGPTATVAPSGRIEINAWPAVEAPVALALLDGGSGRLITTRGVEADLQIATAAVIEVLENAKRGDLLVVAIGENRGGSLVEKLMLLLDAAGGRISAANEVLPFAAEALAFAGTVGGAPGTAVEVLAEDTARMQLPIGAPACLRGAIVEIDFGG